MKIILFPAIMILFVITSISCQNMQTKNFKHLHQGISGQVLWLEGNVMPTIGDNPSPRSEAVPVKRVVHIHELTNFEEVVQDGALFSKVKSELIKTVETDDDGKFEVMLPVGNYSIFIEEEGGLFASMFDMNNNINPVEVLENEIVETVIKVDYKAAY